MDTKKIGQFLAALRKSREMTFFFVLYVLFLSMSLFLASIGFCGVFPNITLNQLLYHSIALVASIIGLFVYIIHNKVIL